MRKSLCVVHLLWILLAVEFPSSVSAQDKLPAFPSSKEVIEYAAQGTDGTWKKANKLPDNLGCRELFSSALTLCEAGIFNH